MFLQVMVIMAVTLPSRRPPQQMVEAVEQGDTVVTFWVMLEQLVAAHPQTLVDLVLTLLVLSVVLVEEERAMQQ